MRPSLLTLWLALGPGCAIIVGGNPLTPSPNPRAKSCTIIENTIGVDAVVTIAATAAALTGRSLRDTGYEVGRTIETGAKIVGAPFALSFAAATIGRDRCMRGW